MTEKRPRVLRKRFKIFYRYDSMFIKDLVIWRHYNVILEKSDITTRPWQRLAIILNRLSANLVWNILVLNMKGKIYKRAKNYLYYLNLEIFQSRQITDNDVVYKFPVKRNFPLPLFKVKNKTSRAFCI